MCCGSAAAGSNSSTLKPLSGDSSECLRFGSLDSLHPFCSFTPFSLCFLSFSFFGSHIYTLSFTQSHTKKNCSHPVGLWSTHRLVMTVSPCLARFLCMLSAWILSPCRNCYYLINAVIVFFTIGKCEIRSPHLFCSCFHSSLSIPPPLCGPVVLINNEFQLDTLAL